MDYGEKLYQISIKISEDAKCRIIYTTYTT